MTLEDILNLKPYTLLHATYGLSRVFQFINYEKNSRYSDYPPVNTISKSGYKMTYNSIYLEVATDEEIIKEINIGDELLNLKTNLIETIYRIEKLDDGCFINDNKINIYTFPLK